MSRIRALIRDFAADQSGATAIEYGFVACLISMVIIGATAEIGRSLIGFFQTAADGLAP